MLHIFAYLSPWLGEFIVAGMWAGSLVAVNYWDSMRIQIGDSVAIQV
jgi:hypothetical protein